MLNLDPLTEPVSPAVSVTLELHDPGAVMLQARAPFRLTRPRDMSRPRPSLQIGNQSPTNDGHRGAGKLGIQRRIYRPLRTGCRHRGRAHLAHKQDRIDSGVEV